jgi:hypothetical protein
MALIRQFYGTIKLEETKFSVIVYIQRPRNPNQVQNDEAVYHGSIDIVREDILNETNISHVLSVEQ